MELQTGQMRLVDALRLVGLRLDMWKVKQDPYFNKFLDYDTVIEYAREWLEYDEKELDLFNPVSLLRLKELGMVYTLKVEKYSRIERVSRKTRKTYKQWIFVGWSEMPNLDEMTGGIDYAYDNKWLIVMHNNIEWDRYNISQL